MPSYHLRRTDRQITDPEQIASILLRGRFVTIATCHDGEPYVVTLSYGYEAEHDRMYFHAARSGRKSDAIAADPRVCATVIIDGGYRPGQCKHSYESAVFTGSMAIVTDEDEARHGMRVLLNHLEGEPDATWERNGLDREQSWDRLSILRLDIDEITAKAGS